MEIRKYCENDVPAMVCIWNEVVEEGVAFPQEEFLDGESGSAFFASQSYCGVAVADGRVVGLYSPSQQHRPVRPHCKRQLCRGFRVPG